MSAGDVRLRAQYRYAGPFHVGRRGGLNGVDRHAAEGGVPMTMARYNLQGTPTLILIDRQGRLRQQIIEAARRRNEEDDHSPD